MLKFYFFTTIPKNIIKIRSSLIMDDYRILYSSQIYLHYLASQLRIKFALQIYIYMYKWVCDINQSIIRLRAIEPCLPSDSRNDESAVSKRVIISHDLFNSASTKKPLRRSVILFSVAVFAEVSLYSSW